MSPEKIKGIIFDMDGVLVDSMKYHVESFKRALRKRNIEVKEKEIYEKEGKGAELIIQDVLKETGVDYGKEELEEIVSEKRRIFEEIENTKPFRGMRGILEELSEKYKLGLVSGSKRKEVEEFLNKYFKDIFDSVISGDDLTEEKPGPKPYIECLKNLGLEKNEVVVIENAPLGIKSAKRAGIYCVAVASYLPKEKLEESDIVLENHEELENYLKNNL